MERKRSLQSIPDDELLHRLAELVRPSRHVEVEVVAHIAEVDERRLYTRAAFPSMFVYCREVLHLSEPEAYLRIAVARASREHPMLLTMLADGRLHLTAIGKLAPHLTRENRDGLLERATHKSKLQIEELIAEIAPRPDVLAVVRKLPERSRCPRGASSPFRAAEKVRRSRTVPTRRSSLVQTGGSDCVQTQLPHLGQGAYWTKPPRATRHGPLMPLRLPCPRSRAAPQSVPRESRLPGFSPCPRAATRCSSPPAPSSTARWNGCER
jgi:hypothetical protein